MGNECLKETPSLITKSMLLKNEINKLVILERFLPQYNA